jgi:hypothetical protein
MQSDRFGGLPQQPLRQPVKYLAEITLVVDRRSGYKLYKYRFNADHSIFSSMYSVPCSVYQIGDSLEWIRAGDMMSTCSSSLCLNSGYHDSLYGNINQKDSEYQTVRLLTTS